jgi:ankyrin repeat protein
LSGSAASVRALLSLPRVDVHAPNRWGQSALHLAVAGETPSVEVVRLLLERGLRADTKDDLGRTPIEIAVTMGAGPLITPLLATPALDLEQRGSTGETLLVLAASIQNEATAERIIRELLGAGANVNGEDLFGETALQRAVRRRSDFLTSLLLAAGAHTHTAKTEERSSSQ